MLYAFKQSCRGKTFSACLSLFDKRYRGGGWRKKCDMRGTGVQKCYFKNSVLFEWPHKQLFESNFEVKISNKLKMNKWVTFFHKQNYLIIMKDGLRNFRLYNKSYYPSPECIKEWSYIIYHILISGLTERYISAKLAKYVLSWKSSEEKFRFITSCFTLNIKFRDIQ